MNKWKLRMKCCVPLAIAICLAAGTARAAAPYDYEYHLVHPDELTDTQANLITLNLILAALGSEDWEAVDVLYADNYVQHNPIMRDRKEGLIELFASFDMTKLIYKQVMKMAEGPYVITKSLARISPEDPFVIIVDINFIRDGKSREHWDIIMPVKGPNKSGRTLFDSAFDDLDNVSQKQVDANKQTVADFINVVLNGKNVDAIPIFIAENYVQNDVDGEDGREAVVAAVKSMTDVEYDIKRIVGQNDKVLAHSRVYIDGQAFAHVDIWRLRDGVLVEHWGATQPVPAEARNRNGMF